MTERIIYGLAAAVILFFTVWLGWRYYHPDERGCAQSIALCKPADAPKAMADCRNILGDLKQRLGATNARLAAQCMVDSGTCNESLSCLSHADRRANELKKK